MSLLGFMAAGAANKYANIKNAETETRNKLESSMFEKEMEEAYQMRREERMAAAEEHKFNRDVARDDVKFERDRGAKKEDFGMASKHDLRKLEVSHGYNKELEGSRQSAEERRTRIAQEGADRRAKLKADGLLNTSANKSSGDLSPKEIAKANESDRKRIFDLNKELTDPMNARNADRSELLKQEIARLQDGIASRTHGDEPPNLSLLFQGAQPTSRKPMQQPAAEPIAQQTAQPAPRRADPAARAERPVVVEQPKAPPKNLSELEATLSKLPYNSPERAELQQTFDSMRPTIAKLRVIEEKLRNLPINASQNERAQLNAERVQLRQEIESMLS